MKLRTGPPEYRDEDIASTEWLGDLIPFLCHKSGGDITECVKCPDRHCKVGNRARSLLEDMTKPKEKPEDPDVTVYRRLLGNETSTPVYELIRAAEKDLSFHPRHFTRNDAIRWLREMKDKHPEAQTDRPLEEALKEERQKDYSRYKESESPDGIGKKRYAQILANRYRMEYGEAVAYIKELTREFGPVRAMPGKKPEESQITVEDIQQRYERAMTEKEILDERYEDRLEKVGEEIQVIDAAIRFYTEMLTKIRAVEKGLEFSEQVPVFMREAEEEADEEEET